MDRIRIYKFGSRSLLKTEELILAIKENKIIKYGRRKYKRWIAEVKYGLTSLHLYCKDIFVPLWRTLRIQYLMWLYKCTSCPCIRAGFAFIAPEPISSATVIQNFFSAPDRFLKIRNFSPKIARVIQTVIHIVIQKSCQNTKKPQQNDFYCGLFVVSPGIEPGTQGFSVLCSTNWAMTPVLFLELPFFSFGIAKVGIFSEPANFSSLF